MALKSHGKQFQQATSSKQRDDHDRRWVCASDEMKRYKYCHCLLFVTAEGLPITEHLPEGHEGRQIYGLVLDPTPDKGRGARHQVDPGD